MVSVIEPFAFDANGAASSGSIVDLQGVTRRFWEFLFLMLVKVGAAVKLTTELLKRRLVTRQVVGTWVCLWLAASVAVLALASLVAPLTLTIAIVILVTVPYSRIAFAVLALHWNRHR